MRRRLLVLLSLGLFLVAGCRAPLVSGGAACGTTHAPPGWGRPAGSEVADACARSVPGSAAPARPGARAGNPGWVR